MQDGIDFGVKDRASPEVKRRVFKDGGGGLVAGHTRAVTITQINGVPVVPVMQAYNHCPCFILCIILPTPQGL